MLDATLGWYRPSYENPAPGSLELYIDQRMLGNHTSRGRPKHVPLLEQLLPMAVERGRRTYSHRQDCRYLGGSPWAWGRSSGGGGGWRDEADLVSLCSCGAGKVGGGKRGVF